MAHDIGQIFMTGISGKSLLKEEEKFLKDKNIGGVILFSRNYESPAQLAELTNQIQACRKDNPLFIAVDQEGGRVRRFKDNFIQLPSMFEMGKSNSPKLVFESFSLLAKQLRACGVNLNLSPVCDVWSRPHNKVIGDRAFGKTPDEVGPYVSSVIRGLQTNQVMACAKHFPGHGDTVKDSHKSLPIIKNSLETLIEREFPPFLKAIKSRVEFVMLGHLIVDCLDSDLPATLSSKAHKYLREEMKYKKLIISDDMDMGAILEWGSVPEASFQALKAGTDIVEFSKFESCVESFNYIEKRFSEQKISKNLVIEKINRITQVKNEYLHSFSPLYIPDVTKAFTAPEVIGLTEKIGQLVQH